MTDAPRPHSSLTVLSGSARGSSLDLGEAAGEFLIGSDARCQLRLEVPGVDAVHARFVRGSTGSAVHDVGSARGVFVNDDKVMGVGSVKDGDVLWLGPPSDPASVMMQCRLAPVAGPEAPAEDFFVAEEPVVADEFVVFEDERPAPARAADSFFLEDEAPAPVSSPPPSPILPEEAFFVDDEPKPSAREVESPPPSAPAPPRPPAERPPVSKPTTPVRPSAEVDRKTRPTAPPRPEEPSPPRPLAPEATPRAASPGPRDGRTEAPKPPAEEPASATRQPPTSARPRIADASERPTPTTPAAEKPRMAPASRRREAAPRPSPPRTSAPASNRSRVLLLAGFAAAGVLVLAGGIWLGLRSMGKPVLSAVEPTRARLGETVTLMGANFAPSPPSRNVVLFGGTPGVVREASSTRLVVEVPEIASVAGGDSALPVTVRVGGRDSEPLSLAVHRAPRINGVGPDVAMPGEEVTLAGTGWGPTVTVRFGDVPAEVLENEPTHLRVRVPEMDVPPGGAAPITVAMGMDTSIPAPFFVGQIPLVQAVKPPAAAPGDEVTIEGRGFHFKGNENDVRVGGVRAFVSAVTDTELRFVVPWVNQGGDLPIELRVPASENVGRGTLAVASPPDAVDFRFAVEPLDVPRSPQAVLSTGLGPAFVLATSGRRSAAERALEAQRRLNEAAGPLKASRDVTFEVRDLETNPSLGLAGRPETILEVTEEDAAAYNEDWTRLGGQGGRVTRERLALWWQALARDLVLLLVRGERPRHAVALAREGRVLSDVFDAAQRTGRFGVPWAVVASAKAPMIAAIRTLALRVPATVRGVVPEPTTGAASTPRPAPAGPLRLEGVWVGSELEGGRRRFLTVSFRGRGGSFTYEGGISVSMPLLSVEQPGRDRVRFTVEESGGRRFYDAEWDGRKLMGRISSGRDLRGDVGAFELTRR